MLPFRNLSKGVGPVVDQVGISHPMLFVVVPLGQEPELVAAVVEPLALVRRQIFAFILRIDEQIRVSRESHLYQPSAVLRQYDQLDPAIGEPLCMPALIIRGFHLARGTRGRMRVGLVLSKSETQPQDAKKENPDHVSCQFRTEKLRCHSCSFPGTGHTAIRRNRIPGALRVVDCTFTKRNET